jgi:hypothetical protein
MPQKYRPIGVNNAKDAAAPYPAELAKPPPLKRAGPRTQYGMGARLPTRRAKFALHRNGGEIVTTNSYQKSIRRLSSALIPPMN